jgi:hypothetical protein
MEWTTRYFLHQADIWQSRFLKSDVAAGPKAYAARQAAQWTWLASDAERIFGGVNSDYKKLVM